MLVRVRPEVRARFERDRKRDGRSLSEVVERQLDAISAAQGGDPRTRAFCYLIGQVAKIGQTIDRTAGAEFDWRTDRFDFEAFKSAIVQIVDRLAPSGKAGSSRYALAETPEKLGQILASMVFALLSAEQGSLEARGDARSVRRGSLFYAFPQAARDLDLLSASNKGYKS